MRVSAIARDKNNRSFGNVLEFKNKLNVWQKWNMPTRLMAGRGDELLKELLDMGLAFNDRQRNDIAAYINSQQPDKTMWSANKVGWMDDKFILPDTVFGKNAADVMFQSESNDHKEYSVSGTLNQPNELLEVQHGSKTLDCGTTSPTSSKDKTMPIRLLANHAG